ncbi:MAG: hypothetical protein ACFNWZ_04325 [Candidatus Absconditicoccaceae bacterium]
MKYISHSLTFLAMALIYVGCGPTVQRVPGAELLSHSGQQLTQTFTP